MIVNLLIQAVIILLAVITSWLPTVTTLPEIVGYDIDTALVNGVGQLRTVIQSFWVFGIVLDGLLVLMLYYIAKVLLRMFIGHRAPG